MDFPEYYGWPNKPTWSAFTTLTSYDTSRMELERLSHTGTRDEAREAVQNWLQKTMTNWFVGRRSQYNEAIDTFMKDMVGASVYYVDWLKVYNGLTEEQETIEGNEITQAAFTLYRSLNWISVIQNDDQERLLTSSDAALRDTLEERVYDWIEKPAIRAKQGPIAKYVRTAFNIWMGAIDWYKLTDALRGEKENEVEGSTDTRQIEERTNE